MPSSLTYTVLHKEPFLQEMPQLNLRISLSTIPLNLKI